MPHSRRLLVPPLLVASLALSGALPAAAADPPQPGSAGVGDRLYPTLGNGGYDARHYSLRLRYETPRPTQGVDGTMTMRARATQSLSRFDLDFAGTSLGSVRVDGRRARWTRVGEELVITPARPIGRGRFFTVQVRHFRADPTVPDPSDLTTFAFTASPDGSVMLGQPSQAHRVFPSNDHPSDKATFSFRFDVPRGVTAVANGVRTGRQIRGGRTIWTYRQRQPMATELTQLAVGRFTVVRRRPVDGIHVRDVIPTRLVDAYRGRLSVVRSQIRWMEQRLGRYPFGSYGSLMIQGDFGYALETQTLSLYDTSWFDNSPRGVWEPLMLHELSHQWLGDSVAPSRWEDIWQNEGHATYYELRYAEARGLLVDTIGAPTFEALMESLYQLSAQWRTDYGAVGRPVDGSYTGLYNPNVYYGGALVLYALEQRIGTPAFRRVERAWVRRNEGRSASTADFVRLASQVSGQRLGTFLDAWLYGDTTPPMPGHPDWTVAPVSSNRTTPDPFLRRGGPIIR